MKPAITYLPLGSSALYSPLYSIIDENVKIGKNAKVGQEKEQGKGIAVVGRNVVVGDGATIEGGQIIDKDVAKEGK